MSRHVHNTDTSVLERRLRPIYDWLDAGNNKKALQECEKVLKKTPNLHCAKALKALTLLRMGKESESNGILDALVSDKPTDEATLQAMTLCYREMQQLEKVCKIYENAVKLEPSNEELHTHLFMSYVRISDFKAQQHSAMVLYKQKPKNPYYCWNVMSIVLQATRGEGAKDKQKRDLLLTLAERMMEKLVDEDKIDAEQEVDLYIMVLDLQKKYKKIITILDGPLGEKLQCANVPQMRSTYFQKMEKWSTVNLISKGILSESFEVWATWKVYIRSVFEVIERGVDVERIIEEYVDNTPERCHEFICAAIEGGSYNSFDLRGAYLARFELCSKLQEKNKKIEDILGDVNELFIEYFRKFGHKPCCVSDLRIYLKLLTDNQKYELAPKFVQEAGISTTGIPQSIDQMQRHIGAIQLSRLCGAHKHLSAEHSRALVTALILHYQHGYQTYGKDLPVTDLGPSDNYALLAAHILYDLSVEEANSDVLAAAAALLESLLQNSPSNFHAKLLLLKFYHVLGDSVNANNVALALDIKHLQLDSLGYVHCARLTTTGLFSLCVIHFDTTLKFFSSNYKDSTDHLTFSYKFGSFTKLEEFMDFREKLNNSFHYTSVVVDRIFLSLLDCSTIDSLYSLDISALDRKIEWNNLRDNRDLQVQVNWEPDHAGNGPDEYEGFKKLFRQDLTFVEFRTQALRSFGAAVDVLRSVDGVKLKNVDVLRQILAEWTQLEENADGELLKPVDEKSIVHPLPSRLHSFVDTRYRPILVSLFEFFASLASERADDYQEACSKFEKELENVGKVLREKVLNKSSDFREKRKALEHIVNLVEILGISCVICHMCNELIKPPASTKKGKRKPTDTKAKDLLGAIVDQIKDQIGKVSESTEKFACEWEERELVNVLESLSLNVDCESVRRNIRSSFLSANKEIQNMLKAKSKMLNGL
ncbi:phagocyte signaling-impaired protein [Cylas formicarius]|uniref:phagocyte signaling-impaired protein n=1 Tax=Cylas formicarius TaxID=197179 RepID=UPI00295847BB|nr:phagocyte signaling-impaired protein [Cylas formicarius]